MNKDQKGMTCASWKITRPAFALALLCLFGPVVPTRAQGQKSGLRLVIILSRHGVRSPIEENPPISEYASSSWPAWDVPPGYLTPHGKKLMELLGAYYRAYYSKQGILPEEGCPPPHEVWLRADNEQRTIESAIGLAAGLAPGCNIKVHSLPEGQPDPLFKPFKAKLGIPDPSLARDAVLGRIGANPNALLDATRPALDTLQSVLRCCSASVCESELHRSHCTLLDLPQSVSSENPYGRIRLSGPISAGATAAQDLLLEYAEGMPIHKVGWGRVTPKSLLQILQILSVDFDLVHRTPYLARTRGSNLLGHILWTMEQAAGEKDVHGALGNPQSKLVVIAGHDTNIANIGGMLQLSWLLPGFQMNETPPGGALVFELWQDVSQRNYSVRTYYVSQTLYQMRDAARLSLTAPPGRADIFIPGCSSTGSGYPCSFEKFREAVTSAIDPQFMARR
ncbi:MAG: histidine-type phosphatase [Terriglobia bacterium]